MLLTDSQLTEIQEKINSYEGVHCSICGGTGFQVEPSLYQLTKFQEVSSEVVPTVVVTCAECRTHILVNFSAFSQITNALRQNQAQLVNVPQPNSPPAQVDVGMIIDKRLSEIRELESRAGIMMPVSAALIALLFTQNTDKLSVVAVAILLLLPLWFTSFGFVAYLIAFLHSPKITIKIGTDAPIMPMQSQVIVPPEQISNLMKKLDSTEARKVRALRYGHSFFVASIFALVATQLTYKVVPGLITHASLYTNSLFLTVIALAGLLVSYIVWNQSKPTPI